MEIVWFINPTKNAWNLMDKSRHARVDDKHYKNAPPTADCVTFVTQIEFIHMLIASTDFRSGLLRV